MASRGQQTRQDRLRIFGVLLCALPLGLTGCGGGGAGSTSPGPDRSADFAVLIDPVSKNTLLKPGQATPITLDLISVNGFPSPVTVSADNLPTGWTAVFAAPTVSSLPKGTTTVVLSVTAPADAGPGRSVSACKIKATGGGTIRYLNSADPYSFGEAGDVYAPAKRSDLTVDVAGVSLASFQRLSFPPPTAFTSRDLTGRVILNAVGLTGPLTVTLANSNPGLTFRLTKSVFPPTNGAIAEDIPIQIHVEASVGPGAYPFTVTATAPDNTRTTLTGELTITP